jgi:ectoine hydroxylase-related dioxygenase (phytanoyl-CoA dioxygenase family)
VDLRRATLDGDGFVIVEDGLSATEMARLSDAVERVWRLNCPNGGALHALSFLPLDQSFVELVDHPAVLPLVVGALGGNVYVYHCHLDVHPPEECPAPRWRWHQDGGRQNVDLPPPRPRLSVKAAYFLTDVGSVEHGPLWVLPGSHRRDTLERPQNGAVHPPGAVPVLVRAGSVVLFDRRLWHARGDNTSGATRKVLFYGYTYRWIRLRDAVAFEPDCVRGLTPVRRQLLGLDASPFGCWFPTPEEAPLAAMR